MLCKRRTSDLGLLPILTLFLGAEYIILGLGDPVSQRYPVMQQKDNSTLDSTISSFMQGKQKMQSKSILPSEGNTWRSLQVDEKAVLSCPPIPLTVLITVVWKIIFRDNTSCTRAYRVDTNVTVETNCTDKRITWDERPDQYFALQIAPVAIAHDGSYICEMATFRGSFLYGYHLQVLVPPQTTIVLTETRTAVCQALAGKPAAQISWTPESDCVTEQENHSNGTVSVQSTCAWEEGNVFSMTCSVFHLTGNRSLSLDLHPSAKVTESLEMSLLIILFMKLSLLSILLVIVGFVYFQTTCVCRYNQNAS